MCSRPPSSPTMVGRAVATMVLSSAASSSTSISPAKTTPTRTGAPPGGAESPAVMPTTSSAVACDAGEQGAPRRARAGDRRLRSGCVDDVELLVEPDEAQDPHHRRRTRHHGERRAGALRVRPGLEEQADAGGVDEVDLAQVEHQPLAAPQVQLDELL